MIAETRRINVVTSEEMERRVRSQERRSAFRRGVWQAAGVCAGVAGAAVTVLALGGLVCFVLGLLDVLAKGW